jgi:hypothetical protein
LVFIRGKQLWKHTTNPFEIGLFSIIKRLKNDAFLWYSVTHKQNRWKFVGPSRRQPQALARYAQ